jgi:hypothetical protein
MISIRPSEASEAGSIMSAREGEAGGMGGGR